MSVIAVFIHSSEGNHTFKKSMLEYLAVRRDININEKRRVEIKRVGNRVRVE